MAKTIPILKTCPACKVEFLACPPGRASRTYPKSAQVFCSRRCAYRGRYRRGATCNQLAPEVAAYIAGFLDGDGSIILFQRDPKVQLRVSFANCNRAVLTWIQSVGGVGNMVQKPIADKANHRAAWFLMINSDAAASLLSQIIEFLHIKQPQAELALWFQSRKRDPTLASEVSWQLAARAQMSNMNRRGPR